MTSIIDALWSLRTGMRLEGNWEADVATFDEILTAILTLSDALTEGIVHQFAEKFAA